jgi:acyl-coenzyme A thioesterase PaaI-like protein
MNVLDIPFVKKVGIELNSDNNLELALEESILNHVKSIHASAQFTLAEAASGKLLQKHFPDLVGKVVPLLRESQVKFKKPALKSIVAKASISEEEIQKFTMQFERKGRASITVGVEVSDSDGTITCVASFNWFVQTI